LREGRNDDSRFVPCEGLSHRLRHIRIMGAARAGCNSFRRRPGSFPKSGISHRLPSSLLPGSHEGKS
jgi:hypothetical protein